MHSHYTRFCNQMCNVLQCFDMVRFCRYCFIEVGWIQTYAQFQASKLVFSLHKNKAVDPWCGLMHWLQDSCLQHLINFLLEALLNVNGYWVARCLFGRNAWVKLYTIWRTRKLANSFKHMRIVCQNLFFT